MRVSRVAAAGGLLLVAVVTVNGARADAAPPRGAEHAVLSVKPQHRSASRAELDRVKASLDRYSLHHGVGAVRAWYVDVPHHTVQVSVAAGAHDAATKAFLDRAELRGDLVTVTRVRRPLDAAAYLYGGQAFVLNNHRRCTDGFNARAGGDYLVLTAGHCARGATGAWRYGRWLGRVRGSSFPGNDYAAITVASPRFWHPQGAVDMHDGYARPVLGRARPSVGARVCKSGWGSGWTCGRVQTYDETVNYGNGNIVYGLVRFNACVEPGDSGGAVMVGDYAVGITSGGQFYWRGGSRVCGQKVGRPNVSFYQPIGEVLRAFNATLMTY